MDQQDSSTPPPVPPVPPVSEPVRDYYPQPDTSKGPNGLATTALVLGILSLLIFPLCLLAIIFGICGLVRAERVNNGKGKAIAGLIMGGIAIFVAPMILLPVLNSARSMAKQAMSMTNMNGIGKAIMLYESANDDEMPTSMALLVDQGYGFDKMFSSPFSNETARVVDGRFNGDIDYVVFLKFPEDASGEMIMGYSKTEFAFKGEVPVLLRNGGVKKMTIEKLNRQLIAEGRPPAE